MKNNDFIQRRILIKFSNEVDLKAFKEQCCDNENYEEKEPYTLAGNFTEDELNIAANKYFAIVSFESNYYTPHSNLQNKAKGK